MIAKCKAAIAGHENMMGHMVEHMQAGPESMAMCPMMKDMGAMKMKK